LTIIQAQGHFVQIFDHLINTHVNKNSNSVHTEASWCAFSYNVCSHTLIHPRSTSWSYILCLKKFIIPL